MVKGKDRLLSRAPRVFEDDRPVLCPSPPPGTAGTKRSRDLNSHKMDIGGVLGKISEFLFSKLALS